MAAAVAPGVPLAQSLQQLTALLQRGAVPGTSRLSTTRQLGTKAQPSAPATAPPHDMLNLHDAATHLLHVLRIQCQLAVAACNVPPSAAPALEMTATRRRPPPPADPSAHLAPLMAAAASEEDLQAVLRLLRGAHLAQAAAGLQGQHAARHGGLHSPLAKASRSPSGAARMRHEPVNTTCTLDRLGNQLVLLDGTQADALARPGRRPGPRTAATSSPPWSDWRVHRPGPHSSELFRPHSLARQACERLRTCGPLLGLWAALHEHGVPAQPELGVEAVRPPRRTAWHVHVCVCARLTRCVPPSSGLLAGAGCAGHGRLSRGSSAAGALLPLRPSGGLRVCCVY
jgi:hypothetical protein